MQMKPITHRFVLNLFTRHNGDAVLYSTRSRIVDLGLLIPLRQRARDDANIIADWKCSVLVRTSVDLYY